MGCGWAFDIQIDFTLAAPEGFFFAGVVTDGRVAVFGEDLVGKHDQFFGATASGVDIDDQLQAEGLDFAETTISDFDLSDLGWGQHNPGAGELGGSALAELGDGLGCQCRHRIPR
jgi:hypothetical protein